MFQQPAFEDLADLVGAVTALPFDLKDAAESLLGVGHRAAFRDESRHRFLAHHVLAGLHGRDRDQGVPAGMGGDGHHLDVLPLEQQAEVDVVLLVVAAVLELHVARGQSADTGAQAPERSRPAAAAADQGPANLFAGRRLATPQDVPRHDRKGRDSCRRALHELPATQPRFRLLHGFTSSKILRAMFPSRAGWTAKSTRCTTGHRPWRRTAPARPIHAAPGRGAQRSLYRSGNGPEHQGQGTAEENRTVQASAGKCGGGIRGERGWQEYGGQENREALPSQHFPAPIFLPALLFFLLLTIAKQPAAVRGWPAG